MGPADLPYGTIMLSYFGQEVGFIIMNFKNFDRFVTKIVFSILQSFHDFYLDAVASRVP